MHLPNASWYIHVVSNTASNDILVMFFFFFFFFFFFYLTYFLCLYSTIYVALSCSLPSYIVTSEWQSVLNHFYESPNVDSVQCTTQFIGPGCYRTNMWSDRVPLKWRVCTPATYTAAFDRFYTACLYVTAFKSKCLSVSMVKIVTCCI